MRPSYKLSAFVQFLLVSQVCFCCLTSADAIEITCSVSTNATLFALPPNFNYGRFISDAAGSIYAGTAGKWSSDGNLIRSNLYVGAPRGIAVNTGNLVVTGTDGQNILTVVYDQNGAAMWTNLYHGAGSQQDRGEVAAIAGGGTVLTGGSSSRAGLPSAWDAGVIKYGTNGKPLWTNLIGSPVVGGFVGGNGALDPAPRLALLDHPALDTAIAFHPAHHQARGYDPLRIEGRPLEVRTAHLAAGQIEGAVHGLAQGRKVLEPAEAVLGKPVLVMGTDEAALLGVVQEPRDELIIQVAMERGLGRFRVVGLMQAGQMAHTALGDLEEGLHHMFPAPGV